MVRKLGPIGNLLGMLPGAGKNKELLSQVSDKDLDRAEAIVRSMTPEERRNPKVINGSRRARIANGSGVAVGEVSQLVTNFYEGQKQMKAMFERRPCPACRPAWAHGPPRRGQADPRQEGQQEEARPQRRPAPRRRDSRAAPAPRPGRPGPGQRRRHPARPRRRPAGLGGLGGLPEGFPESLADGLANLPSGLNFPPPQQGNIPAAFRGNKRRDKKK